MFVLKLKTTNRDNGMRVYNELLRLLGVVQEESDFENEILLNTERFCDKDDSDVIIGAPNDNGDINIVFGKEVDSYVNEDNRTFEISIKEIKETDFTNIRHDVLMQNLSLKESTDPDYWL